VAAHLTIATGRPVIYEYTREEEFIAARSRHPMIVRMKTGVKKDGTITANDMYCISDTGAYGCHALTVAGNTGHKAMALYVGDGKYREQPNIRFVSDVVYTNTPPSGAFRGYGVPQGFWPVERHMEGIANALGMDPIEFRMKNALRQGELQPFSTAWSEGREPVPETIETNGLEECVRQGRAAIGWDQKYKNRGWQDIPGKPYLKKGVGVALVMQGTAIPYLDMGGASIKMNEDGSFNLLMGATDIGTGSDTMFCQIAAETLAVPPEKIIPYSSDTDMTPFDPGAYASSTTYISGRAVEKAARSVLSQILEVGGRLLKQDPARLRAHDGKVCAADGRFVTYEQVCLSSLYQENQFQIMGSASHMSYDSPPPFAAVFVEVEVDIETGLVRVLKVVEAVDCGQVVNPKMAEGQVEGAAVQSLGYALYERMPFDGSGRMHFRSFRDYTIAAATDVPEIVTILVPTHEPTGPYGAKAVAEIPINGPAPAIANAVAHATGARLRELPLTPDRVLAALDAGGH
jgi:putative selenate reductase molybdopterin-binding subunit